jgi:hypothetical protein
MKRTVKTIVNIGVLGFTTSKVLQELTRMKKIVKELGTVKEQEILQGLFPLLKWGVDYSRELNLESLEFKIPCAGNLLATYPEAEETLLRYISEGFPDFSKLKISVTFIPLVSTT